MNIMLSWGNNVAVILSLSLSIMIWNEHASVEKEKRKKKLLASHVLITMFDLQIPRVLMSGVYAVIHETPRKGAACLSRQNT